MPKRSRHPVTGYAAKTWTYFAVGVTGRVLPKSRKGSPGSSILTTWRHGDATCPTLVEVLAAAVPAYNNPISCINCLSVFLTYLYSYRCKHIMALTKIAPMRGFKCSVIITFPLVTSNHPV